MYLKTYAGLDTYEIVAPAIISLAPFVIRSFAQQTQKIKLQVILFKNYFILEANADPFLLDQLILFEIPVNPVIKPDELEKSKISTLFEMISTAVVGNTVHKHDIIRNLLVALVYETDSIYHKRTSELLVYSGSPLKFELFRQLVSQNYMAEHKLEFYAKRLNMLPKSLSAAVRKYSGKPAGRWIDETLVMKSKVLLYDSSLSISQISDRLNFNDQSVFRIFFFSYVGVSPLTYRKQLNVNNFRNG